jgi:hypothetical protein
MFDLEAAIAAWRHQLVASTGMTTAQRTELEAHLRDEIDGLSSDLSTDEAFIVAKRRLGDPAAIGREFEVSDPVQAWRGHAGWLTAGIMVTLVFGNVRGLCAQLFMLRLQHDHASTAELVMMPVVAPVLIALAVVLMCAVALHRASPRPINQVLVGWLPIAILSFAVNAYLRSHAFTDLWSAGIASDHERTVMSNALGWTPLAMFLVPLATCAGLLIMSHRRRSSRILSSAEEIRNAA